MGQSSPGIGGEPAAEPSIQQSCLGMSGGGEIAIDGQLRQQRSDHLNHRLRQQEGERNDDGSAIGPQIVDQPPHETTIVSFAENFFFHRVLLISVAQTVAGFRASRTPIGSGSD